MEGKLLLFILEKAGLYGKCNVSTVSLASKFSVSQQTASMKLRQLEEKKLIRRIATNKGTRISLDEKGIGILKKMYNQLKKGFEKKEELKGTLSRGIGEGKYYVKLYSKRLEKAAGFAPYFGTLNIKAEPKTIKEFLFSIQPVIVDGFETDERSYGKITCYPVMIQNIQAAAIFPERATHPPDIVEVIAPVCLREKLKLKDDDEVTIRRND